MPLLPPQVIGPVSPCNRAVLVRGQIPGHQLRVFANDRLVGDEPATAVEQAVALLAGEALAPGELVRAEQSDPASGETSLAHPDGVEVMPRPEPLFLGAPSWLSRLHECGRCIMIGGFYPGSQIWVTDLAGATVARTETLRTVARFFLDRPIGGISEVLTAHHEACGVPGADARSPAATSFMNAELPPPEVGEPLFECMRRVYVGGVYEGAAVGIVRTIGADRGGCFDAPELYIGLPEGDELRDGEEVSARQGYPDCDLLSPPSEPKPVHPAATAPAPRILPLPCAGSDRVVVDRLVPDAVVYLFVDGVEIGHAAAAAPTDVFLVPPEALPASGTAVLTAHQVLCGFTSPESDGVPIESGPLDPGRFRLGELFGCVTTVQVAETIAGALIEVRSDVRGLLARTTATGNVTLLSVPALRPGETILASQRTCGAETSRAMAFVVDWRQPLRRPTILGPVLESDRSLVVDDALQGALIEVWVNDELVLTSVGIRDFDSRTTSVSLARPLARDDRISVRQRLCADESSPSSELRVRECSGRIRIGLRSVLAEDRTDYMPILLGQAIWARRLFRNRGIDLLIVDRQALDLPRFRSFSASDRGLIRDLAREGDDLGDGEIACYLVPDGDSGGAELPGTDAAIVWRDSEYHHLAHELLHVFGLTNADHAPSSETWRVFHPGGFPPAFPRANDNRALSDSELETVRSHPRFFHPCT